MLYILHSPLMQIKLLFGQVRSLNQNLWFNKLIKCNKIIFLLLEK